MKSRIGFLMKWIIALTVCFGLAAGINEIASADNCNWLGVSSNWASSANWSCGHVPTSDDNVTIPGGVSYAPEVGGGTASVEYLTIQTGGSLTLNSAQLNIHGAGFSIESGADFIVNSGAISLFYASGTHIDNDGTITINPTLSINGYGDMTNDSNGSISLTGTDHLWTHFKLYIPFNNDGDVDADIGVLNLYKGGTHGGTFTGSGSALLTLGDSGWPGQTFTFGATSELHFPYIVTECSVVNINGEYWPGALGTRLKINNTCNTNRVVIDSTAPVVIPQTVEVLGYGSLNGELVLEAYTGGLEIQRLKLSGNLRNKGALTIKDYLTWTDGRITEGGTTTIDSSATLTLSSYHKYLVDQHLINKGEVNWDLANMSYDGTAIFENDGTFNANATTSANTDLSGSFINDGTLKKLGAGTITTFNVDFVDNGTIEVITGTLVLPDYVPGDGATIKLGDGILDTGDTLTVTENITVTGSGSLNSNLINGGTVSPGESPGSITVNGNYIQVVTGTLAIDLGGVIPAIEHDQLIITGTATLSGTLDVFLESYVPEGSESFIITTYASHTGVFSTVNLPTLPGGLDWNLEYGPTEISLDVITAGDDHLLYLPIILR